MLPDIQILADGIMQCNQEYVERSHLDERDYGIMIRQYILTWLLGDDFGFYDDPEQIGYFGWLKKGDCTLFFGPTKAIVLCGNEQSEEE